MVALVLTLLFRSGLSDLKYYFLLLVTLFYMRYYFYSNI